jgi:hypothetical protein
MRRIGFVGLALLTLAIASGCVVHKDEVVARPPVTAVEQDCWVKVYDGDHFSDLSSNATIRGPVELPTLDLLEGKNWNDQIESLIVGPHAEVQVWKSKNYAGTPIKFTPNQKVEKLGDLNYEDDIESIKVTCGVDTQ